MPAISLVGIPYLDPIQDDDNEDNHVAHNRHGWLFCDMRDGKFGGWGRLRSKKKELFYISHNGHISAFYRPVSKTNYKKAYWRYYKNHIKD